MSDAAQPSDPPARPIDPWRIARIAALAIVATIAAIWLILSITKGRFLKAPFERYASSATDRRVAVGGDFQLYFAPFDIKFVAERISVSNPAWASRPNLFQAARVDTRIAPLSLLFGKRRFRSLDVVNGLVALEWDAAHRANTWTFGDGDGKALDLPVIDRATLVGTRLGYRDPRLRLTADVAFDTVRSTDARIGEAIRFTGGGRLRDTPYTMFGQLLSPNATVARRANRLEMRAEAAGNVVDIAGRLPGVTTVENVPLAVAARGPNIADLIGIIGVAVPESRAYRLRAQLVKRDAIYRFTRLAGRVGESDIAGALTVRMGQPRLFLDAELATRRLHVRDAAPIFGYDPQLVARGAAAAAGGTGRLLPDARLRAGALANFDAALRWRVAEVIGAPIRDIDLTLALDDRRLTLAPVRLDMARGRLAAAVIIDARARPARTSYDIRLAPAPMGRVLANFGVSEAGTTGTIRGRLQLQGTGDTVHDSLSTARGRIAFIMPAGTLWTRNAELAELDIGTFVQKMFARELKEPVRINCGLVGFTVRNGVAAADPILIDTRANVITGRGGFSFRTEAIDLAFRADSKRFSLFSGQSPVAVAGRFADPAIDPISPELLGRVGAGLGLAAFAFPPAALLAFVDVGDAKAADCGPVLAGAAAAAQRTGDGERRDDVEPEQPSERPRERRKFLGIF